MNVRWSESSECSSEDHLKVLLSRESRLFNCRERRRDQLRKCDERERSLPPPRPRRPRLRFSPEVALLEATGRADAVEGRWLSDSWDLEVFRTIAFFLRVWYSHFGLQNRYFPGRAHSTSGRWRLGDYTRSSLPINHGVYSLVSPEHETALLWLCGSSGALWALPGKYRGISSFELPSRVWKCSGDSSSHLLRCAKLEWQWEQASHRSSAY